MTKRMASRHPAPRYPLTLAAEVTKLSNGFILRARTADVSRTGCYVETRTPLSPGTEIHVHLARAEESLEIHAKVVHARPGHGMGIAFLEEMAPSQIAVLECWLHDVAISVY